MKMFILTTLLILGLTAQNYGKPIIDIYSIKEPVVTEESYIDDIPFNTWEIAVAALFEGDEVKLTEEENVNDIPFDTRTMAMQYLLKKMEEQSGESNVNDIPFDTEKVMYEEFAAQLTEQYREEQSTSDLPENDFIICDKDQGSSYYVTVKISAPVKSSIRQTKIHRYDYPIIIPVKLEIPQVELKNKDLHPELIAIPSLSL
jgi:hypothetical protein